MILERRQAVATALTGELAALAYEPAWTVHPYKPDALAPPVGYVDHASVVRDGGTLRTLRLQADVVLVADGLSMAARQRLDESGAVVWRALGRVNATAQTMTDEILDIGDDPYPVVRLVFTTPTECT